MKYTFGEKIKKLRKERKLSQKEMAKQSGIPAYTIISLELNRSKVPSFTTVIKLAKFFKVSLDELNKDVAFD